MTPEKIGRYEIQGEIGRGGMATVFKARDPLFERVVAVKVLPPQMTHEPEFRARFEREAKTIAALEHPAIVPVYDFGEENGQPYLVMRLMPGRSLADRLRQGPIDVVESAAIMKRIASALDAAHRQGIVHRDLKPGNILFDQYGEAYLADFGIVRLSQSSAALTASGGVLGTPAYMSPEQVYGDKELDGRADIYALGVILFQMLTGQVPYEADTPARMMMKHVMDPVPPLLAQRPDLPHECEAVIQKAMAKERDERYPTAKDLSNALLHISETRRTASPFATPETDAESPPLPHKTPIATPERTAVELKPEVEDIPSPAEPALQPAPLPDAAPALDAAPATKGRPAWIWIAGVVILVLLAGAGGTGLVLGRNARNNQATATAVAIAAANETGTAVAAATQTAADATAAAVAAQATTAASATAVAVETSVAAAAQATAAAEIGLTETAVAAANEAATATAVAEASFLSTLEAAQTTATAAAAITESATATPAATTTRAKVGAFSPLFGPINGELVHDDDNLIESSYADVNLRDVMVQASVRNPFTTKQGRWDWGITFRQSAVNAELRLVVRSDGYWSLNNRDGQEDNFIQEGNVSEFLDLSSVGSNEVTLLALNETGYFLLNGNFISQLDLSERTNAGDLALGTGFYTVDEQEGFSTPYEDFTVWPLNRTAGPLVGELEHVDNNLVKSVNGDVTLRNFVTTATFANPYGPETGSWDYGFTFRRAGQGEQFWLILSSSAEWNLVDRRDGEDNFLSDGTVTGLNEGSGDENALTLIALDERGYLLLNDTFVTSLNLSSRLSTGEISAVTAFFVGNEIEGNATGYANFAIWALP